MKANSLLKLSLFALFTFVSLLSFGQQLPEKIMAHPRILFLEGQEDVIKKSIQNSPIKQKVNLALIKEANDIIGLPPLERIQTGRRLLSVSREYLRRVLFLGYAYRLNQDEKYLKRMEQEMLNVANFSNWNPSHFLDVAEMTTAMAIAYDWFYQGLSQNTKAKIKTAIIELGINPSYDTKNTMFLTAHHNWNQVCNAGMAFGALAIYDEEPELAKKTIERAIESIKLPMTQYAPDGAYPEGYAYWGYGTTFNVLFIDAMMKAFQSDFGLNQLPGFDKTAAYLMHMIGPSKNSFNYSDCSDNIRVNPAMFWFAELNQDPSLLFWEKELLKTDLNGNMHRRFTPLMMIWGASLVLDKELIPKEKIWAGSGDTPVALMRSSWDGNGIFIGLKAGSPHVNHAHMDIGSFVMDAMGERWAIDFGASSYNLLESQGIQIWGREQDSQRWDVFRYNNLAHSTLSFNNQFQKVYGFADIDKIIDTETVKGAMTDISAIYKTQVKSSKRAVAIIDNSYVVVTDQLVNNQEAKTLQWRMPTNAKVKSINDSEIVLSQNGKTLRLKLLSQQKVKMRTWSTKSPNSYDEANPNSIIVGFEMELEAKAEEAIQVALIPENNKAEVKPTDWKVFE
ncbi:heparinase II/III domain-containing protein [Arcticibacterium luteifluviistationis]|uniref:Heparinase n=1 Tax=Arcticibacterium luteifluviistationis TaxID=1784714 RepID=A0A2Z4GHL0_9BACT|nr:heparinase II/III family protein [Arcticibacterium luteifluviistationis]AWW00294.1 heparinase [Arcticibacterium luteifluviistationis]